MQCTTSTRSIATSAYKYTGQVGETFLHSSIIPHPTHLSPPPLTPSLHSPPDISLHCTLCSICAFVWMYRTSCVLISLSSSSLHRCCAPASRLRERGRGRGRGRGRVRGAGGNQTRSQFARQGVGHGCEGEHQHQQQQSVQQVEGRKAWTAGRIAGRSDGSATTCAAQRAIAQPRASVHACMHVTMGTGG